MKGHILGYSVIASGLVGLAEALAREWWVVSLVRGQRNV